MNKQQFSELVDLMFSFDSRELEKETDFLKDYKKLKEQNDKFKEIIDKAIEYIEETWKKESYYEDIENCVEFATINEIQKDRLLNLLKGDDK